MRKFLVKRLTEIAIQDQIKANDCMEPSHLHYTRLTKFRLVTFAQSQHSARLRCLVQPDIL